MVRGPHKQISRNLRSFLLPSRLWDRHRPPYFTLNFKSITQICLSFTIHKLPPCLLHQERLYELYFGSHFLFRKTRQEPHN